MEDFKIKFYKGLDYFYAHTSTFLWAGAAITAMILFMIHEIKGMVGETQDSSSNQGGFNTTLPFDNKSKLENKNKHQVYSEWQNDSINNSSYKEYNIPNMRKDKEVKEDSLDIALKNIENFQFQEKKQTTPKKKSSDIQKVMSESEKEISYREKLLKSRNNQLQNTQDFSIRNSNSNYGNIRTRKHNEIFKATASIFRNQYILPGDRVRLILNEDVSYNGIVFKKNSFIYAKANIQNSRVILNVNNINKVPVKISAYDMEDGDLGLHSDRAGELWEEFETESKSNTLNELGNEVSNQINVPLVGSAVKSLSSFFKRKKYREKSKILLVDEIQIILSNETK